MPTLPVRFLGGLILACLVLVLVSQAQAQSTWNSTTGNWNTSSRWSPASVPASDSSTSLIFGGSASYTSTNNLGLFTLNQMLFTNTAGTATVAGTSTNGLDLVRSAQSLALPTVIQTGAGNVTISAPVTWDADTAVTNSGSGTLQFSGTQTYLNGTRQTFTNSGTGTLTIADGITYANSASGSGGVVLNLVNNNTAAGTFNIGDMGALANVTLNIGGTGTVRYNGSSAGDLFSDSMLLNVQAGATFDFNGNAETMGSLSGAGTVVLSAAVTLDPAVGGYHVFSGKLTGSGGAISVADISESLILSGSTSDYTTATSVTAGRLIVAANAPNGAAGALGNATSDVLVGGGAGVARLLISDAGVTIGRNVRSVSGGAGLVLVGGLNTSGTATYSGSILLGTDSSAAKGVTLYAAKGGTVEFTGSIVRAASATGTTDTVTISGAGTVALRGSNTYTGGTVINGGTLLLDYSSNTDSKVSNTAALDLSGGSLSVLGSGSASTTVTLGGLNVGSSSGPLGGGQITVTTGQDQNATLALGGITKNAGGTVNFVLVNTGSGVASITTTTANNSSGILGAYATFALNDWAVNDGTGNITALAAGGYSTTFATGLNTSRSASVALPSGGATTGSLRLTGAAAVTFNAIANTLTLESGGILVASTAGATSFGTTSVRGNIASSTGEVIIHQQSASTLTINSIISGTTLTKSGDGALVLTGTNTYTGNTIINGGSVSVTASANLGAATADVTINGGTLILASGSLGTLNATNRVITVGALGATFNFTANQTLEGSGLAGTGTLTLAGSGTISVGSSSSTFSGDIVINNGTLRMNSQQFNSVASITVNSGGTYEVNDDGAGTFGAGGGGRIFVNGNGFGSNGALRVTDQSQGSASFLDPSTTIANEVVLQTTSRIQVDNGSALNSSSLLTLAGVVSGSGGIVKGGNGTLAISGHENTFTGGVSVENGTLSLLGDDRLLASSTINLGAGSTSGTLRLNGYSQTVTSLTTAGSGTANAVVSGSGTSTSVLTVNTAGTQSYGGTLGGSGLADTHTNNNLSLSKQGAGSFTLANASTYDGITLVEQGTLVLGNVNALGNGGNSLAAGDAGTVVQSGATLDLNGQSGVQEVMTLNGSGVDGAGALVNNSSTAASIGNGVASLSFSGSSTGWTLASAAAISASTSSSATAAISLGIGAGTFTMTNNGAGYGLAPVVTVSGGTGAVLTASLGVTTASFTVTSGTTTYSTAPTVTLSNGATGTAVLNGSGLVIGITITNPGSGFTASPGASFSGGTTTFVGTAPKITGNASNFVVVGLNVVNPGSGFTSVPTVTISSGTGGTATAVGNDNFALNGIAVTANGSDYASAPTVTLSGGSGTATANLTTVNLASDSSVGGSGDLKIDATVTGSGALTKVGTGTTTLTGTNTYTGNTTVSAGTLQVGMVGYGQTGAGAVTVNGSDAVLAGTGSIQGSTSIILGVLKPGDSGGADTGTLNTHNLIFVPVATTTVAELQITGSTAGGTLASDLINVNGALTLSSNGNILVNGTGYTAAVGDTFTLLDWSGVLTLNGFSTGSNFRTGANGDGNEGNLDLPDITGIGVWQIGSLADAGALTLSIVAVPEPARGVLVMCGCVVMVWRRRRR
ncbi:beta strand repeat-containing protein [Prosthecobacter sp.]|uniref:beta strand repeat-containing protein n=1 Tax=Prosthecobacter sp. TaxID=1965333 RepID=UPI003783F909